MKNNSLPQAFKDAKGWLAAIILLALGAIFSELARNLWESGVPPFFLNLLDFALRAVACGIVIAIGRKGLSRKSDLVDQLSALTIASVLHLLAIMVVLITLLLANDRVAASIHTSDDRQNSIAAQVAELQQLGPGPARDELLRRVEDQLANAPSAANDETPQFNLTSLTLGTALLSTIITFSFLLPYAILIKILLRYARAFAYLVENAPPTVSGPIERALFPGSTDTSSSQ